VTDKSVRKRHWNAVYTAKASESVSWFQSTPSTSLELIEATGAGPGT
jgi:hypothetical protein